MQMTAASGCHTEEGGSMTLTVTNPIIKSFGLSVTSQNMMVSVNLDMTFVALDVQSS
jgi:hypothetical protein